MPKLWSRSLLSVYWAQVDALAGYWEPYLVRHVPLEEDNPAKKDISLSRHRDRSLDGQSHLHRVFSEQF